MNTEAMLLRAPFWEAVPELSTRSNSKSASVSLLLAIQIPARGPVSEVLNHLQRFVRLAADAAPFDLVP